MAGTARPPSGQSSVPSSGSFPGAARWSTSIVHSLASAAIAPTAVTTGAAITATTGNVTTLDCADPSRAASTITAAYAVFYDAAGGTDATNLPICYWDLGGNQSSTDGAFTLTVNASGLTTATAA